MTLRAEGLVRSTPQRGFRVYEITHRDVTEAYEVRILLEAHAIRTAIPLLTVADVDDLTRLFHEMESETDAPRVSVARERFYLRLFRVAGSRLLYDLIVQVRDSVPRWLRLRLVPFFPANHETFFMAVQTGDTDLAVAELTSRYKQAIELSRRLYLDEEEGQRLWTRDSGDD